VFRPPPRPARLNLRSRGSRVGRGFFISRHLRLFFTYQRFESDRERIIGSKCADNGSKGDAVLNKWLEQLGQLRSDSSSATLVDTIVSQREFNRDDL
jgi:hypothetical protein